VQEVAGHFAAVDHRGRLAEVGWEKFPTLMHAAWAAQWLDYERRLAARLILPAVTLQVFHDEVRVEPAGVASVHHASCQVRPSPPDVEGTHRLCCTMGWTVRIHMDVHHPADDVRTVHLRRF
jgi:hypothetical protein